MRKLSNYRKADPRTIPFLAEQRELVHRLRRWIKDLKIELATAQAEGREREASDFSEQLTDMTNKLAAEKLKAKQLRRKARRGSSPVTA